MNVKFYLLTIIATCLLAITACGENTTAATESPNPVAEPNETTTPAPTLQPTPEPTPGYTFEEVILVEPQSILFNDDSLKITSTENNYYGAISIGEGSYIEDTLSNSTLLTISYNLFIVDDDEASYAVEIKQDGYYEIITDEGTIIKNMVEYPYDKFINFNPFRACKKGDIKTAPVNNLSYSKISWSSDSGGFSGGNFNKILSAVITKEEAIEYAVNGTLPECMRGADVTGLDEIIAIPNNDK